jgi:hypothetical protein
MLKNTYTKEFTLMNKKYFNLHALIILVFCLTLPLSGADKTGSNRNIQKVTGSPAYTYMDINNISTIFRDNGISDIDAQQLNSGFVFPKGSGKTCAFESGFLWGGKINDSIKVGGSSYNSGLQSGKILSPGVAEDPDLAKNRIYRVRPDYKTASLTSEASNEGKGAADLYAQFDADWQNWPAADGAPYTDVNNNGQYDPDVDIPGVAGADLTIWYVANDLNSTNTVHLYGSTPMGMELQVTVWGYAQQGALGNMFFRRYLLINKGNSTVDSMYVSQWSDIDDGNATDDYAGCDTLLSLGYMYNANAVDATYDPLPPPAVGFDFFQGPVVAGTSADSAIFRGHKIGGKKNLPMTAFYYFARGDANVTDPTLQDYNGTIQMYNFFHGRVGKTGASFVDPNTGIATPFALAGDPVTRKGWIDGQVLPAGDRRLGLASGPFTMAPGDSQEVVVAEIAAGAIVGVDRLSAIGLLKFYDQQAQLAYDNFFNLPTPPPAPKVVATTFNKEILLNWGEDYTAVNATENFNAKGYTFQGYNVYQVPSKSATISQALRVATFDVVDGVGKIKDYEFDASKGDVLLTDVQFGNDVGVKRFLDIKIDDQGGGGSLINGKKYYYAVTAYSYNPSPSAVPNNLESPLVTISGPGATDGSITPHSLNPGVSYSAPVDKILNATHTSGIGDATVFYKVIDPSKLTGATYTIGFHSQPDKFVAAYAQVLDDGSAGPVTMTGSMVLDLAGTSLTYSVSITNVDSLTGPVTGSIFADSAGTTLKNLVFTTKTVLGKRVATASGTWTSTDESQPLSSAVLAQLIAQKISVTIETAANPTGEISVPITILSYPWYLDRGTTRLLQYQQNYSLDSTYAIIDGIQPIIGNLTFLAPITFLSKTLKVNGDPSDVTTPLSLWGDGYSVFGDATGTAKDFYGGGGDAATQTDFVQDLEFRFTGVPSDPAHPTECTIASGGSIATVRSRSSGAAIARIRIPFELWEVERNRQINVAIVDRNADGGSPWGDTGTPQWYRIAGRDYIVAVATPYTDDASAAAITAINRTSANSTWIVMFNDGESGTDAKWHTGDVYDIAYGNNMIPGTTATSDIYQFTVPAASSYSKAKAIADVEKINVFPNPYYAANSQELNKYQHFVSFNHLPVVATIRIFNLAGVLVRTILRNDAISQYTRWDLTNENGLPVASGLYIAYVDMPDLGTTKILKFTIIQKQQILDRF